METVFGIFARSKAVGFQLGFDTVHVPGFDGVGDVIDLGRGARLALVARQYPGVAEGQIALFAVVIGVADYAKTRDWYKDVLGVGVTNDDGKQCYLTFGDSWILPRNQRQPGTAPKVDHIAYTIETWDMNGVEAKLKSYGLTPRKDTENSFHVKDPDGFDVQISGREMTNKEIKK